MKKISISLLFCWLGLSLFAQQEGKKVIATASMISDIASNIAGPHLNITCIVPIGGDPHLHEPTPRDAQLVNGADLILKNGLTFEGWLNELIENSGTKAKSILVTEGVDVITSKVYKNATDPHAWMNALNGVIYAENIKNAFSALDPAHAADYQANFEKYKIALVELDQYIGDKLGEIPQERRILITSHDAFQYYGRRYGIQLESVLGTSTDADVQTSDVVRLNEVIKKNKVPAVFIESTIRPKLLEQLAKDNNIKVGGKLYADSIGDKDSPASTYLKMLRHNTDVIHQALSQKMFSDATDAIPESSETNTNYYIIGFLSALFLGGFFLVYQKLN
ncbi:MAG: metal ABC transporter solute-binding protein, Zn/Mn family [Saprospiraceae bacterium]